MLAYYQKKKDAYPGLVRAAMAGDGEATYQLARNYYWLGAKHVVEKNPALCFDYANRAAEAGHLQARVFRAYLYSVGTGVEKQLDRAIAEFQRAWDDGSMEAAAHIAKYYMIGEGLPLDPVKGMDIYRQVYAHHIAQSSAWIDEHGYTSHVIKYPLGLLFGIGVAQDRVLATELLQKAARVGFAPALRILRERRVAVDDIPRLLKKRDRDLVGSYYPLYRVLHEVPGQPLLVIPAEDVRDGYYPGDYAAACAREEFENIQRQALGGDVNAAYRLAGKYYSRGVRNVAPENRDAAFLYMDQAARAGHPLALVERATMYIDGIGVAQDVARGMQDLEQAWIRGNRTAGYELARMYLRDYGGIVEDAPRACAIYRSLYERLMQDAKWTDFADGIDESDSIFKYPLCLIQGVGTPADPAKGVRLLRDAAAAGFTEAQEIVSRKRVPIWRSVRYISLDESEETGDYLDLSAVFG